MQRSLWGGRRIECSIASILPERYRKERRKASAAAIASELIDPKRFQILSSPPPNAGYVTITWQPGIFGRNDR
jgi:hypothetical protein